MSDRTERVDLRDILENANVPRVLTRVMCWENGMVMAFDQFGEQMPSFQGRKADVMEKIYDAATKDTVIEGDVVPLRWRH